MNVIFLDIDGVLRTIHYSDDCDIEKRIILLSEICRENNCKVVISAAGKRAIDDNTLEGKSEFMRNLLNLFRKHNIEVIGKTPDLEYTNSKGIVMSGWKEEEIIRYLIEHPEVDHFCVIDDDDMGPFNSDLNKVRSHLVKPKHIDNNPLNEGLLEKHKGEVEKILRLDNKYRSR